MNYYTKLVLLAIGVTAANAQRCATSDDCVSGVEYCAGNACTPIGSCSQRSDCFNPDNFPFPVTTCAGYMDCNDSNLCSMVCGEQVCPDGGTWTECVRGDLPCDMETCAEADSCFNDPCGGGSCKAVFYDAGGNVVCADEEAGTGNETQPPEPEEVVTCNMDLDCDGAFNNTLAYCSKGECTPMGTCSEYADCVNPSNVYAVIECVGPIQCDAEFGQCGRQCGPTFCPEGVEEVSCVADPCMDYETECPIAASCVSNYCGECKAILFDDAGYVLEDCDKNSPKEAVACNMDLDCDGAFNDTLAYCSKGECTPMGTCSEYADCVNPSNVYAVIECVGPIQCDAEFGQCGRQCGPTFCPEGVEEVSCVADPCMDYETKCPIAASCVSNYCGECNAILFDDAGYVLEDCDKNTSSTTATQLSEAACISDMECAADGSEYCADGTCLPIGQCNERVDCFNPANGPYPQAACVGLLDCADGFCSVTCGPECPNGEERAPCPESSACNITSCDEAVSCTFDGCGGECTEIFFDDAGTQVCVSGAAATEQCTSDADCVVTAVERATADGMYCAQGVCMEKGTCNDDLDCMNPSNIYASLGCVGYTSCESGRCGVTYGPECKDGSAWSVCDPAPCDNSTCAAAISCTNDLCNGCNAIFFDAAGSQVESCDIATFSAAKDIDSAFCNHSFFSGALVVAIFAMSLLLVV
jgi:hypothetical protein